MGAESPANPIILHGLPLVLRTIKFSSSCDRLDFVFQKKKMVLDAANFHPSGAESSNY